MLIKNLVIELPYFIVGYLTEMDLLQLGVQRVVQSVMVLLMESSKTDLGFIKFVQDGFQNKSHESTSANV
jgi:hypothetical protein